MVLMLAPSVRRELRQTELVQGCQNQILSAPPRLLPTIPTNNIQQYKLHKTFAILHSIVIKQAGIIVYKFSDQ